MKRRLYKALGLLSAFPLMVGATVSSVSYGAPPYAFTLGPYYGGTNFSLVMIEFEPTFTSVSDNFYNNYCYVYNYLTNETSSKISASLLRTYKVPIVMYAVYNFSEYLYEGAYCRIDFHFGTNLVSHTSIEFSIIYAAYQYSEIVFTSRTSIRMGRTNYAYYDPSSMKIFYDYPYYQMPKYAAEDSMNADGTVPLENFDLYYQSTVTENTIPDSDAKKGLTLTVSGELASAYSGIGTVTGDSVVIDMRYEKEGSYHTLKPLNRWALNLETKEMIEFSGNVPSGYIETEKLYFPPGGDATEILEFDLYWAQEGRSQGESIAASMSVDGKAKPTLGHCQDSDYCVGVEF